MRWGAWNTCPVFGALHSVLERGVHVCTQSSDACAAACARSDGHASWIAHVWSVDATLPPCALVQSVNPYINVRLLLEKNPICIGRCDQRDLAIISMHGVVGFGYKRVWGSPTLVRHVSLGLACVKPAPVSWAALLLISVSVLEHGPVERGSNVRSCMYVPLHI